MTKHLLSLILIGLTITAKGQNVSVEKSIFNIQAGIGIWVNNESRLSNQIALRSEVGLDGGIFMGGLYDEAGFLLAPVVTLEPRWYYNLNRRNAKSKNISGNSGNFVSLQINYNPDLFVISGKENLEVVNQVSAIPTWGIRRVIGHFNYETGIGLGVRYIFGKSAGYQQDETEAAVNLHLRIGYKF